MNLGFEFIPSCIDFDQAFYLTILNILTISFNEELRPANYYSFYFFHLAFYVFWFRFGCFFFEALRITPVSSESHKELILLKIFDKKLEKLIILHPLRKTPISKSLLSCLVSQIDRKNTKILINSNLEFYYDLSLPGVFVLPFDLFDEKIPFAEEISKINKVKYLILTDPASNQEECEDYNAILASSVIRQHFPKALISTQLRKMDHLFLEWADWDFVMSSDNIRVK